MQAIKSLTEHMLDVRERLDRKESNLELNIFAEEIERARNVTIDTVRDELPKTVIEPYGKVEFFPEYDNPPGYEQWLEMRKEGFTSQAIPGMDHATIWNWDIAKNICDAHWMFRQSLIKLPYKNIYFGKTFRVKDEEWLNKIMDISEPGDVKRLVFGITREDLEFAASDGRHYDEPDHGPFSYNGYVVGTAANLERKPTRKELKDLARKPMVRHVFGIEPPTEEEIKEELQRIHGISERSNTVLNWVEPEDLSYPMPRGVFYTYKDAKESGIFENLAFGLLEERRRVRDPVLAGKYKGFRIPLCYWS